MSIGVDTVQQPAIIFLDEPTSGLGKPVEHEMPTRNATVRSHIQKEGALFLNNGGMGLSG